MKRSDFSRLVFDLFCLTVVLLVFCFVFLMPRQTFIPNAPPSRAPSVTPSPFEVTRVFTNTPIVPTVSVTPTNAPTHTPTQMPTLTPTLQPTDTRTPTLTPINTIQAGRSQLTPLPLPNTGASAADIARMTRIYR